MKMTPAQSSVTMWGQHIPVFYCNRLLVIIRGYLLKVIAERCNAGYRRDGNILSEAKNNLNG